MSQAKSNTSKRLFLLTTMSNLIRQRRVVIGILLISAVSLIMSGLLFHYRDYGNKYSYLSGDEPHYIMMVDSLVKDGDFDLRNDYELKRAQTYYPDKNLFPHVSPIINQEKDPWYSIHTIGLPLLISGSYGLFGVIGVRLFVILLGLGLILVFAKILKEYLPGRRWVIGCILLITAPVYWQNVGSLFPDLLVSFFWLLIILNFKNTSRKSVILLSAITILLGLIHTKALILAGPLYLSYLILIVRQNKGLGRAIKKHFLILPLLLGALISYVCFLYINYGVFSPSGLYGSNGQIFGANPIFNTIAIFVDRNKGMILHFPLIAVAGPYLVMITMDLVRYLTESFKKGVSKFNAETLLVMGVLVGLVLYGITILGFSDWSGSTAPNGRSILPFVLVTIFAVSKYLNIKSRIELLVISLASLLSAHLTWRSISSFVTYMSPGVNSFWVDHFSPLNRLPIYPLEVAEAIPGQITLGIKVVAIGVLINISLYFIYTASSKYKRTNK